uniref:Transmembrane protein n=1 Tax=Panagrolaimus sp. PS1159 TaxID=55785 RepID=A0AC35GUK6_9BILA
MKKNSAYLFLFLILWISQNVFCKYQKCLATTNYYTQDFDGDEFKVFSQFSIQNNKNGPNIVTVSNITVDLENAPHFENVCIVPENQEQICFNDFPKTVKFSLENSTFQMLVDFGTKDTLGYFPAFGIIDQGSIVFENGGIFSQEQPCQTLYIPGILLNRTSCCTSFVPAASSMPSTAPCKKFKSISSVRNVNENFKISASSQAVFSYTNTNLYANLTYTQQNNGGVDLAVNAGSLDYQA